MAKQLQIRGGTTVQHSTFTGALREITIDTDKDVVVVHDGTTAGGFPLAKQTSVDSKVTKVTSTDNAVVRFNGVTGEVQNSGVIIDDSGSINTGSSYPWLSNNIKVINIEDGAVISGSAFSGAANMFLCNNLYYDANTVAKYKKNGIAQYIAMDVNGITFSTAPTGVAGNTAPLAENVRILNDGTGINIGSSSVVGNRSANVLSGTLVDGNIVSVSAKGGTAGTINRASVIGVYKHAGITNSVGYIQVTTQDAVTNSIWVDDVDQLRISTNLAHIGTTSGTVVGTQTSDERVKNIVGPCPYGLQEILDLETYKYSMKDDVEGSYKLGFVAQQAMGVIPESVYDTNERLTEAVTVIKQKVVKEAVKDEEGNILEPEVVEDYEDVEYQETSDTVTKLAMDYQMMIPVLVNAVKEQQELINSLTARLDRLEGNL